MRDGDRIAIDIPARKIELLISDAELAARRAEMDGADAPWQPAVKRSRVVTAALRVYAAFAESADKGGFRRVP